jgi:uncharacterized membrane protein YfcA
MEQLGLLLIGSLPGIVLASWCAARVPDAMLRVALAVTLIVAGAKLLFEPPSCERSAQPIFGRT